jgi:hypothetical protein
MAMDSQCSVQEIDVRALQEKLVSDPCLEGLKMEE